MKSKRGPVKKEKTRIKVSSAKQKGRSLQQWVGRKIADITGFEFGKDCPIESRPMGQSGCDIRMEKQVKKVFPFGPECKYQESWGIPKWIQQAKENQEQGVDWLLFIRKNRHEAIVVLDAEVFFELMEKIIEKEEV